VFDRFLFISVTYAWIYETSSSKFGGLSYLKNVKKDCLSLAWGLIFVVIVSIMPTHYS
jgi:hypothetical protein